jgi:hypothetical protein
MTQRKNTHHPDAPTVVRLPTHDDDREVIAHKGASELMVVGVQMVGSPLHYTGGSHTHQSHEGTTHGKEPNRSAEHRATGTQACFDFSDCDRPDENSGAVNHACSCGCRYQAGTNELSNAERLERRLKRTFIDREDPAINSLDGCQTARRTDMSLERLRQAIGLERVISGPLTNNSSFVCHLGGDLGQLRRFDFDSWQRRTYGILHKFCHINVVERYDDSERSCVVNQPLSRIGGDCLPPLVMPHIALGAAHTGCQSSLGHAQSLSDGFDRVHILIMSGTCILSQHCHCYLFLTVAVMI